MAIFRGPIKQRHSPARWNLQIAGEPPKPNNRDVRGRFRTTRPDPKWYTNQGRKK